MAKEISRRSVGGGPWHTGVADEDGGGGGGSQSIAAAACVDLGDDIDVATGGLDPLANGGTIDGVTLADGSRVLLLGQNDGVENGVWLANTGAWTRPDDFAGTLPLPAQVYSASGGTLGGLYVTLVNVLDSALPITVGVDPMQNAGGGSVGLDPVNQGRAGGRLTLGNPLLVNPRFSQINTSSPAAVTFEFWLDPTNGAAVLHIDAATIDGTFVHATIPLTP